MESLTVDLGERSYRICIAPGLISRAGRLISSLPVGRLVTIVTNTTVAPLYLDQLMRSLQDFSFTPSAVVLPDGEQHKNLHQTADMYRQLVERGLDRTCPIVALGGGVVGDIAGFTASTFLRGVPLIQVPTTLLSQVDSSVGGKTGVNLAEGKNLVGTFYQPSLVIIDTDVLKTLPGREFTAGMAEVIKYGIIRDRSLFESLLKRSAQDLTIHDTPGLIRVIKACCSIKAGITSRDERESNERSLLNFGHTVGHAVETLTGYASYKHGEAVSIGMAVASRLSCVWGLCAEEDSSRVTALLKRTGLPTELPVFPLNAYLEVIEKDKKKSKGVIRMVLMRSIGEVVLENINPERLAEGLSREFHLP